MNEIKWSLRAIHLLCWVIVILLLAGCGSDNSDGEIDVKNNGPMPSIFSLWAEGPGCRNVHLQQYSPASPVGKFGEPFNVTVYFDRYLETLAQCNMNYTLTGNDKNGSYTITDSVYVNGSGPNGDPGCNSLNTTGIYWREDAAHPFRPPGFFLFMQPASGETIQYHYCPWDVETSTSTCETPVCGIL